MTSYSPVSSVRRSPIRSSIGNTPDVPGGSGGGIPGNKGSTGLALGLFFSGRGLGTRQLNRAPSGAQHHAQDAVDPSASQAVSKGVERSFELTETQLGCGSHFMHLLHTR